MTISNSLFNYAVRRAVKMNRTREPRKLMPPSYNLSSPHGKLKGIEELGGVGVLYKYDENYILDFSKAENKGLSGFNLFGVKIPSLTLPTPKQVINTATGLYRNARNTAANVRNAIIVTARSGINSAARIGNKGIQTLMNVGGNSFNFLNSTVNAYKRNIANRLNSFKKTVINPAAKIIRRLPRAAASAANRKIKAIWNHSTRVANNLIKTGENVARDFNKGINKIGQSVVNVANPAIKAVQQGVTGITSGMLRQFNQTVSALNKIESILIKLSTSKKPKTRSFLRNFNALYGGVISKAKRKVPAAKKEAGLGFVITTAVAIVAIIGLSGVIFKALETLQTYLAGNSAKALADLTTAEANKTDSETKGKALEDGAENLKISNEEWNNLITAYNSIKAELDNKKTEIDEGKQEREKLINAINDKQTQLDSLNQQINDMGAAGIAEDDPRYIAVVQALQAAGQELSDLKNRKNNVNSELSKDQQDYDALLTESQQAKIDAENAKQKALEANNQYNNLVGNVGLPTGGYEFAPAESPSAGGDIFGSITQAFSNPMMLLGAGALAVLVLKK